MNSISDSGEIADKSKARQVFIYQAFPRFSGRIVCGIKDVMKFFTLLISLGMMLQGIEDFDLQKAIQDRHAVRKYLPEPLSESVISSLESVIVQINEKSGLNIQLVTNDSKALSNLFVSYGRFSGAKNYFALVGPDSDKLLENVGYYGELVALICQSIGLNTCWVGGTFQKNLSRVIVNEGEEFVAIIAVGYGKNQGTQHISKPIEELADGLDNAPQWYVDGVKSAMLGPSALNKQSFHFSYESGEVSVSGTSGQYSEIDAGIAKLHFEIGSGKGSDIWK